MHKTKCILKVNSEGPPSGLRLIPPWMGMQVVKFVYDGLHGKNYIDLLLGSPLHLNIFIRAQKELENKPIVPTAISSVSMLVPCTTSTN